MGQLSLCKRTKRKTNFTIINNDMIHSKTLSFTAKGVLSLILSLPDDWIFHKSWLIKNYNIGRRILDKVFKELHSEGYMVMLDMLRNNGRFVGRGYYFYEIPMEDVLDDDIISEESTNLNKFTDAENEQWEKNEKTGVCQKTPSVKNDKNAIFGGQSANLAKFTDVHLRNTVDVHLLSTNLTNTHTQEEKLKNKFFDSGEKAITKNKEKIENPLNTKIDFLINGAGGVFYNEVFEFFKEQMKPRGFDYTTIKSSFIVFIDKKKPKTGCVWPHQAMIWINNQRENIKSIPHKQQEPLKRKMIEL